MRASWEDGDLINLRLVQFRTLTCHINYILASYILRRGVLFLRHGCLYSPCRVLFLLSFKGLLYSPPVSNFLQPGVPLFSANDSFFLRQNFFYSPSDVPLSPARYSFFSYMVLTLKAWGGGGGLISPLQFYCDNFCNGIQHSPQIS